jgi:predicted AAA+ superfamily ATPase
MRALGVDILRISPQAERTDQVIDAADTPVVLLNGARQTGKSTLAAG